jgi:hypothetical protein
MSLLSAAPQTTSACFDDLPNELVDLVVSFLIPGPWNIFHFTYRDENGNYHRIHQAIPLMHVCSRFRRAVFRAKFWHDFFFEFDGIFGRGTPRSHGQIRRNSIYKHLFANEDLIGNLETKSEWVIAGPEMLVHILSSLPNFLSTARQIQLYWATDYNFGLRQLRPCRNLKLLLGIQRECLDLSLFQWLDLNSLDLRFPETHHGNLHGLKGLKSFQIDIFENEVWRLSHDALPLASAGTLTSLDIADNVDEKFSLEAFTNLDNLRYMIPPYDDLRDSFYEVIAPCPSRLRRFETYFVLDHAEDVSAWAEYQCSLFILPCLQHLKQLTLSIATKRYGHDDRDDTGFRKSDEYVGLCMDILEALARNLLSLEKLVMCAGLDVSRVQPLGSLKMLKELKWTVDREALRGVPVGTDLIRCIPTWFEEFVENAYVSVDGLQMRGKKIE